MRGKKCWKRVTAVLMAFMMLVGLVMTNGITSEAYWYNSEGERYPNVGYRTHVQSKGWERKLTLTEEHPEQSEQENVWKQSRSL